MRPALLRGLTVVLLAASAVGVLRLPVTLLGAHDDDRIDLAAPATVPSHVVRLPAPVTAITRARVDPPRIEPPVRSTPSRTHPAPKAGPAAPAARKPAPPKPPARRRVVRIIRAEPSTQAVPAATPEPVPVVPAPAAEPAPVAAPVAATVAVPVERRTSGNGESKGHGRRDKDGHGKHASPAVPEPQLLASVELVTQPASTDEAGVTGDEGRNRGEGDGDGDGHGKRDD